MMKHFLFGSDLEKLKIALLIKDSGMNKPKLEASYLKPVESSIPAEQFVAFNLHYDKKKVSAACAKEYINVLLPEIIKCNVDTLLVADADYFSYFTGYKKPSTHYGYVYPCIAKGFEHVNVILAPNFQALIYNPNLQTKMTKALETLQRHMAGNYQDPGINIIKNAHYPHDPAAILTALNGLHQYKELTCDIEARSLSFWEAGISTITFCWNKHEGIAFPVDRGQDSELVRYLLKEFLQSYKGKLTYHNIGYDAKVLIYELWMNDLADYKGMLEGIDLLTRDFDDTKLIAYLATNNAVQNELGLKAITAEFTGNYAQEDIADTEKIPLPELLIYNLTDGLATWYAKEKYYPTMVKDQQQDLYEKLFKPIVKVLLQTELCGMPINPVKVQEAEDEIGGIANKCNAFFKNSTIVKEFHYLQLEKLAAKMTEHAVKKVYSVSDEIIYRNEFNPNSGTQVRELLYEYLNFPVVELTKVGKQPSTSGDTLEKLLNHTENSEHLEIIENLRELADASIILSTFIKAFKRAQQLPDGSWRLYGNFNLGGTQSLRLSSSNPNLTNLPSSSTFAKIIKACFEPVKGWLFLGSDYDSLEDKVNALITRDPNKLKVYTDGYDGHCLRALSYFGEQIKGIDPDSPQSVNLIKKLYKSLRQDSKAPTFALTYNGTYITLMRNCGFSEEKAKQIEAKYHEMYKVADEWIADKIEDAKKIGYIPLAFGGRIRTPLLAQTVGEGRVVPFKAQAEARSAGNAATQSYCILTLRSMVDFFERVWKSEYRYCILPSCTIHDAIYLMCPEDATITKWVNDNLIESMEWQDLPELQHPTITMSSELGIFWPNWANEIGIPVRATKDEIKKACKTGADKYRANQTKKIKEAA